MTERDNGRSVKVRIHSDLVVALESDAETGPRWALTAPPSETVLRLKSADSVPPRGDSPPQEVFTWEAVAAGNATVRLDREQPGAPPTKTFSVAVAVVG